MDPHTIHSLQKDRYESVFKTNELLENASPGALLRGSFIIPRFHDFEILRWRQRLRQDTKKLIIDATIRLYKEKGIDNVTIADICKVAGVTKKTLYYHFTSKQDIMLKYLGSFMKENPADVTMRLALMKSFKEKLRSLYFSSIDAMESLGTDVAKSLIRTYLGERGSPRSLLSFYDTNPNSELGLELIKLGQENGEISEKAAPELLQKAFVFSVSGALLYRCAEDGGLDDRAFLESLFNLIFDC
jgi:AcrR family transcriptional regulator